MQHYLDITLRPNADIDVNFLWERVFQQVHLGLADSQKTAANTAIGIAFPDYNSVAYTLGNTLRLLTADAATLAAFDAQKWLSRLDDYVRISPIHAVPAGITRYGCFSRVREKDSARERRHIRRLALREKLTIEQVMATRVTPVQKKTVVPFIHSQSQSNGERFRLLIGFTKKSAPATSGSFSAYGLSGQATVPIF